MGLPLGGVVEADEEDEDEEEAEEEEEEEESVMVESSSLSCVSLCNFCFFHFLAISNIFKLPLFWASSGKM